MPFDSAEFFGKEISPASTEAAWHTRLAAALGRVPWSSLFRSSPEPVDLAVLRVLEEARGLIEQRDEWVQGEYETFHGERCAVGALRVAASLLNYPSAGRVALDLVTAVAVRRGYRNVETMNDHSRHQHVLTAFDSAIGAARHRIAPTAKVEINTALADRGSVVRSPGRFARPSADGKIAEVGGALEIAYSITMTTS